MEHTETAFWHHAIDHAGFVIFTASGIRQHTRLQNTVQHAVQFGVASCRAATHSKHSESWFIVAHTLVRTLYGISIVSWVIFTERSCAETNVYAT